MCRLQEKEYKDEHAKHYDKSGKGGWKHKHASKYHKVSPIITCSTISPTSSQGGTYDKKKNEAKKSGGHENKGHDVKEKKEKEDEHDHDHEDNYGDEKKKEEDDYYKASKLRPVKATRKPRRKHDHFQKRKDRKSKKKKKKSSMSSDKKA